MSLDKIIAPILLILLVSLSLPTMANTGRIVTMSGDVKVNGQFINKRYRVKAGDEITTGLAGRVNIVMTDKSVLDLQPNTRFKLEQFSFNRKAPKKSRSIMNLLKGSFRYISGLVGRSDHNNATIRMGTATAGIRGSFATFGFDGKEVSVDISLGQMTMTFSDGSTMTVNQGQSGRSRVNGQGRRVAKTSVQNPAMKAARDILNNPDPEAVKRAMEGLSEAEKAMVVAVIVANPTQLNANTAQLSAAMQAVTAVEPAAAPLIAAIVTAVAENEETAAAITNAVKEVPGVDGDAIDAAVEEAAVITDDSVPGDEGSTPTEETDNTIVVDEITITTTPRRSSGASGGDGTGSTSTPTQ